MWVFGVYEIGTQGAGRVRCQATAGHGRHAFFLLVKCPPPPPLVLPLAQPAIILIFNLQSGKKGGAKGGVKGGGAGAAGGSVRASLWPFFVDESSFCFFGEATLNPGTHCPPSPSLALPLARSANIKLSLQSGNKGDAKGGAAGGGAGAASGSVGPFFPFSLLRALC